MPDTTSAIDTTPTTDATPPGDTVTVNSTDNTGDTATAELTISDPIPVAQANLPGTYCNGSDPRALAVRVDGTITLTSSVPATLFLQMPTDHTWVVLIDFGIDTGQGMQCLPAGNGNDFGGQFSATPNTAMRFTAWYVIENALTADNPSGDPTVLHEAMAKPDIAFAGEMTHTTSLSGPRVETCAAEGFDGSPNSTTEVALSAAPYTCPNPRG